jgi:hypothetical protein
MNPASFAQKHYHSAQQRFLLPSIRRFLQTQCPKVFGPFLAQQLAQKIVELVEEQMPKKDHLKPGQLVWNAVSVASRPDSPTLKLVPVILTLVDPSDIQELEKGARLHTIAEKAVARICCEAHQQGALLTMRDIGLFVWKHVGTISTFRSTWEKQHATTLPHCGSLQDFGSCISHKKIIVKKVITDKKDTKQVAAETKHSQLAVDRYLKDFHRVETCYRHNPNIDFIAQVTALSPYLVKQYVEMINAPNR